MIEIGEVHHLGRSNRENAVGMRLYSLVTCGSSHLLRSTFTPWTKMAPTRRSALCIDWEGDLQPHPVAVMMSSSFDVLEIIQKPAMPGRPPALPSRNASAESSRSGGSGGTQSKAQQEISRLEREGEALQQRAKDLRRVRETVTACVGNEGRRTGILLGWLVFVVLGWLVRCCHNGW